MTPVRHSPLELMRRHVDALYTRGAAGRLLAADDCEGSAAPRFWLGRTREGCIWRFGASLPADVAGQLDRLCRNEPPAASDDDREPANRDAYLRILAANGDAGKIEGGPCYGEPAGSAPGAAGRSADGVVTIDESNVDLLKAHLSDWMDVALQWQPMVVALDGGHAASVCASVRRTGEAHEAGVDTAPAFRRRGFARRAVAAWLVQARRLEVEPLYSTSWENAASRALAASLGLPVFGSDFAVF